MTALAGAWGVVRLVHPAPAATVVALTAALGAILSVQHDLAPMRPELLLTTLSVAGSQVLTGALNDWADRDRDARVQSAKPIPSGAAAPSSALALAGFGAALQLAASVPLGPTPTLLGVAASASAAAYNLRLSRTPLSVVPYLVSFGILPLWVAAGVGVPLDRVAVAPLLVGPFAAAAHLANALRDFDADARIGSGNLAQLLGRGRTLALAGGLSLLVGLGVGAALLAGGRVPPSAALLGVAGLLAVGQGLGNARRLWAGMLVAALCWTVAWALATG